MSIRYDMIQDGVIIVLSFPFFFFLSIPLEQLYFFFSGPCGIFGRRLAGTGLLAFTSLCWFGLLLFRGGTF